MSASAHPRRGLIAAAWLVAGLLACLGGIGSSVPAAGLDASAPAALATEEVGRPVGPRTAVVAVAARPARRRRRLGRVGLRRARRLPEAARRLVRGRWVPVVPARSGPSPVRGPPLLLR